MEVGKIKAGLSRQQDSEFQLWGRELKKFPRENKNQKWQNQK